MLNTIRLEEGIRGLYRGVVPAMLTLPVFLGIYWPVYESLKRSDILIGLCHDNQHLTHLSAAVVGEGVSSIITNPLWVIRTRIQTDYLHQLTNTIGSEAHNRQQIREVSMRSVVRETMRNEGLYGFSRGISASLLGLSFPAIQFPLCKFLTATRSIEYLTSTIYPSTLYLTLIYR